MHSKSVNTMRMILEQVVLIVSSLLLFHDILPCCANLRLFVKISEVYSSWRSISFNFECIVKTSGRSRKTHARSLK